MKKIASLLAAVLIAAPVAALAAGAPAPRMERYKPTRTTSSRCSAARGCSSTTA